MGDDAAGVVKAKAVLCASIHQIQNLAALVLPLLLLSTARPIRPAELSTRKTGMINGFSGVFGNFPADKCILNVLLRVFANFLAKCRLIGNGCRCLKEKDYILSRIKCKLYTSI